MRVVRLATRKCWRNKSCRLNVLAAARSTAFAYWHRSRVLFRYCTDVLRFLALHCEARERERAIDWHAHGASRHVSTQGPWQVRKVADPNGLCQQRGMTIRYTRGASFESRLQSLAVLSLTGHLLPLKNAIFRLWERTPTPESEWTIFINIQNYSVDQIKENEMGGACGTYGRPERCIQGYGWETQA
jgi:hypothetical protein